MLKWDDTYDQQLKAMSDADLVAAYNRTIDDEDHPDTDGLLTEIKRRNLHL